MAAGGSIDALSQFKLEPVLGLNFTQANVMMVVAGLLTVSKALVALAFRCGVAACSNPALGDRTISRFPRCPISLCPGMYRHPNATGKKM